MVGGPAVGTPLFSDSPSEAGSMCQYTASQREEDMLWTGSVFLMASKAWKLMLSRNLSLTANHS